MEQELSLLIVFAAGLLSFVSPCVLPLIPGYIAFVSGLSINNMTERGLEEKKMAPAMLRSVMFVLGFSVVGSIGDLAWWFFSPEAAVTYNYRRCGHNNIWASADRSFQIRFHADHKAD